MINMHPGLARTAGLIYLVVIITGMFSLAYVPKQLIDWHNSEKTFQAIHSHAFLFRLGIYSSVVCYIAFAFLAMVLFWLFRQVSETLAGLMAILALLSVPLSFNNLQHKFSALSLTGKDELMQALNQYDDGILLATVFWGLWLFPFGLLVYRCGWIHRFFGLLLIGGCLGYLINFTGNTLLESYAASGLGKYFGLLPAIAETGICFRLLFLTTNVNAHAQQKN
jgi:hypothetical protein